MTILSRAFPFLLRRSRLLSPATAFFYSSTGNKKLPAPTSPGGQKAEKHAASLERKDRLQRPMEVPHQEKVENVVHLIGSVAEPIRIVMSKGGIINAVSILVREATGSTPKFWIPIVFQGELAETAVCHVKVNDVVYVTGELCGDKSALSATNTKSMHHFQVAIHDFRFVNDRVPGKNNQTMQEKAYRITDQSFVEVLGPIKIQESLGGKMEGNEKTLTVASKAGGDKKSSSVGSQVGGDEKSLSVGSNTGGNGKSLHIHSPESLGGNIGGHEKALSGESKAGGNEKSLSASKGGGNEKSLSAGSKAGGNEKSLHRHSPADTTKPELSEGSQWRKFVDHPEEWIDYRKKKQQGLVKPRHPDFKHKDTRQSIWMDSLPEWVVRRIDCLSFAVGNNLDKSTSPASEKTSVELWKNLVENPDQWVDNRTSKTKPNHPDFKHKITGKALWLGCTTPTWVRTKITQLRIATAA